MISQDFDFGSFAYGFWRYTEDQFDLACKMVGAARDAGIDHLDTADIYGNESGIGAAERMLGRIAREAPALLDGATVATKGGIVFGTPYNSSKEYLTSAVDKSLGLMGVEQIDLYYIHRPDLLTHPAHLAETLDGLVTAGKLKAVAVSNFTAAQVEGLKAYLKAPLIAHQIEFSSLHIAPVTDGTLDQAMRYDIAVPVWSPVAGGQVFSGDSAQAQRVRGVIEAIAAKLGRSTMEVALSFVTTFPARTVPILGTRNPERLREAVRAKDLTLDHSDWYDIYEAATGEQLP